MSFFFNFLGGTKSRNNITNSCLLSSSMKEAACVSILSMTRVRLKRTPFGYLFSYERTEREGGKKP